MSNRNTYWAEIFVDALAQSGLDSVCIAPGSRSTALTLAFAKHGGIKVYSHLDERSASFFALGLALAAQKPVALVCTSGTAAANFFPAVIEAHQTRVPLIVITADRPPELRHSGANQTIDQIKMYGDYVLWAVDTALPEANPSQLAIRNLQTTAARAIAIANGIRKGAVHINMPFTKPLEPIPVENDVQPAKSDLRFKIGPPPKLIDEAAIQRVATLINDASASGIIVCGPNCPEDTAFTSGLFALSEKINYPVIADPLSHVRVNSAVAGYETFLAPGSTPPETPEIILRFGNVPTSKWLNEFLGKIRPKHHIQIKRDGVWADDNHTVDELIQVDEAWFCEALVEAVLPKEKRGNWPEIDQATWHTIDKEMASGTYFDGAIIYDIFDLIPDESTLFIGNSLPIRHVDQFGKPQNNHLHIYGNRGASGIDGNTSTALGTGAARPDKPLIAILGDVTFYHDMNGLLAVQRLGIPITIVLMNNNGGGIFHRLPIKDFDPEFTELFVTPHGLDYQHTARLYGLEYTCVEGRAAFQEAFTASVTQRNAAIIEVRTDAKTDLQRRNEIVKAVQTKLHQFAK